MGPIVGIAVGSMEVVRNDVGSMDGEGVGAGDSVGASNKSALISLPNMHLDTTSIISSTWPFGYSSVTIKAFCTVIQGFSSKSCRGCCVKRYVLSEINREGSESSNDCDELVSISFSKGEPSSLLVCFGSDMKLCPDVFLEYCSSA